MGRFEIWARRSNTRTLFSKTMTLNTRVKLLNILFNSFWFIPVLLIVIGSGCGNDNTAPQTPAQDTRPDFFKGLSYGEKLETNVVVSSKAQSPEEYLGIITRRHNIYYFPYRNNDFVAALEKFLDIKGHLEIVTITGDSESHQFFGAGDCTSSASRHAGYFVICKEKPAEKH